MAENEFTVTEVPENYEQKCCCALVLDVSSSMKGSPMDELNDGLREFYGDISKDPTTANRLEVAIVEFSSNVETLVDPSLVANFRMPTLTSKGTTKLAEGVLEGINIVRMRKQWYKDTGQPYYRPWVILITDGAPDSDQNIVALAEEINDGMNRKDFFFLAIGVQNADMQMLLSISSSAVPPLKLQGLKFSEFFRWLSASFTMVTSSTGEKADLPPVANWAKGFSV